MAEAKLWAVVNIGCIECGVSSNLVGVYDDEEVANQHADRLQKSHSWREGGQNDFVAFPVGEVNVTLPEYAPVATPEEGGQDGE